MIHNNIKMELINYIKTQPWNQQKSFKKASSWHVEKLSLIRESITLD